jgi:hypothetical protein
MGPCSDNRQDRIDEPVRRFETQSGLVLKLR